MLDKKNLPRLRLLPINHIASQKLRKAGVEENMNVQPVFQLMEWGIVGDKRQRYRDIAEELAIISTGNQMTALNYLLENVPGGVRELLVTLMYVDPPGAAKILLNVLDMRLKADPSFPQHVFPGKDGELD